MNKEYEQRIYDYCDDVNRMAKSLDYDMVVEVKMDIVISRLKLYNYELYDEYEILVEAIIEEYFNREVPYKCIVL